MKFASRTFVLLDRDGVINRKLPEGQYIARPEDLELLPGATDAIAALNRAGRRVIVLTNQRAIALGLLSEAGLQAIHQSLQERMRASGARVDAIYHCPHDKGMCHCRKPEIGMIEQAFRDFPEASANNSVLIGDSLSDIEAGRRAGIPAIFIEGHPEHRKPGSEKAKALADAIADSLLSAVNDYILPAIATTSGD